MTLLETLNQEIDYLVIQEKKFLDSANKVKNEDIEKFVACYSKSLGIRFAINRLKIIVDKYKNK
ncbi:MAG: hypothetical protein WC401_02725 [Bacteroidales bacterium]|jgi:hypothetical protein